MTAKCLPKMTLCYDVWFRREAKRRFGESFFSAGNNFGSPLRNSRGRRVEGLPIFWEFVQYVKRSPMADEHWAPVYR